MKVLLLFLFIPLSYAGRTPDCKELARILEGYEKVIQHDSIKGCNEQTYKELVKDIKVVDGEYLKDKACQDLSTIETQLNQLKTELAVLSGIDKLVETVKKSKEGVSDKKPEVARVNAHSFLDSLNTAQSLEILLATNTEDGKSFMELLKDFPKSNLLNENDLKDRVQEMCKGRSKTEQDACNPKFFSPRKVAGEEIIGMIKNTESIKGNLDSWKNQLAIKRKDKESKSNPYTFTQMQQELAESFSSIDEKRVMTKQQLSAITALDDFEFDDKFSFVKDIKGLRDQKKMKEASDKFFLLMGDAKQREQYQAQSKLSIAWNDVRNSVQLSPEDVGSCDAARTSYPQVEKCYSALEKALPSVSDSLPRSKLKSFLPALKTTLDYVQSLDNKETSCREEIKSKEAVSEACYAEFNRDRAKIQDQILQLNIVKDKIGAQNVDNMLFRNFTLYNWTNKQCKETFSSMDLCEDTSILSKDALMTLEDGMKISVVYSRSDKQISEAEKRVEPLCHDGNRKRVGSEDRLCEFFYGDTAKPVVKKPNNEAIDGPVAAPDGKNDETKLRDGWIQGMTDIARTLLPAMYQQNPAMSPYPYNYSPYGTGTGPMGIADTILFNARYYGAYGYYMPTPGYQPYSAFGSGSVMSAYKPVAAPATRYFSY